MERQDILYFKDKFVFLSDTVIMKSFPMYLWKQQQMSVHSRKQLFPRDSIKTQFSLVVYRPKHTSNISAILPAEVIHGKKHHQISVVVILTVLLNTAVTGQLSQKWTETLEVHSTNSLIGSFVLLWSHSKSFQLPKPEKQLDHRRAFYGVVKLTLSIMQATMRTKHNQRTQH